MANKIRITAGQVSASATLVEFWNRYYYYFKELLVRFFFMPVFMQLGGKLRDWPRLRLFVAVFAAAFVGNIYYVGTKELSSFLIVTPAGNILLDSGMEQTVPLIRASIDRLGFKSADTKILIRARKVV